MGQRNSKPSQAVDASQQNSDSCEEASGDQALSLKLEHDLIGKDSAFLGNKKPDVPCSLLSKAGMQRAASVAQNQATPLDAPKNTASVVGSYRYAPHQPKQLDLFTSIDQSELAAKPEPANPKQPEPSVLPKKLGQLDMFGLLDQAMPNAQSDKTSLSETGLSKTDLSVQAEQHQPVQAAQPVQSAQPAQPDQPEQHQSASQPEQTSLPLVDQPAMQPAMQPATQTAMQTDLQDYSAAAPAPVAPELFSAEKNAAALRTILAYIEESSVNSQAKGARFEKLIIDYLAFDKKFLGVFSKVQPYISWANQYPRLARSCRDVGIDIVATNCPNLSDLDSPFNDLSDLNVDADGAPLTFTAIQCKFYDKNATVLKSGIDSFCNASDKTFFTARYIAATNHSWSTNALNNLSDKRIPIKIITLSDLESSSIDWTAYLQSKGKIIRSLQRALRPYQQTAVQNVVAGLAKSNRGKLIMACGTGKTYVALNVAEQLTANQGFILFLVPSIALLSQTITEWKHFSQYGITAFAVCSDSMVGRQDDSDCKELVSSSELTYPANTDPEALAQNVRLHCKWGKAHQQRLVGAAGTADAAAVAAGTAAANASKSKPCGLTVIFSTYQSIEVVASAQHLFGMPEFDLIICDEAHRTTGCYCLGDAKRSSLAASQSAQGGVEKDHRALNARSASANHGPAQDAATADLVQANSTQDISVEQVRVHDGKFRLGLASDYVSTFTLIHNPYYVLGAKRLYMTATPRVYGNVYFDGTSHGTSQAEINNFDGQPRNVVTDTGITCDQNLVSAAQSSVLSVLTTDPQPHQAEAKSTSGGESSVEHSASQSQPACDCPFSSSSDLSSEPSNSLLAQASQRITGSIVDVVEAGAPRLSPQFKNVLLSIIQTMPSSKELSPISAAPSVHGEPLPAEHSLQPACSCSECTTALDLDCPLFKGIACVDAAPNLVAPTDCATHGSELKHAGARELTGSPEPSSQAQPVAVSTSSEDSALWDQMIRKDGADGVVMFSMDDPSIYGKTFYSLSFSQAVEMGCLVDFQVLVLAVDAKVLPSNISFEKVSKSACAKIVGIWKAMNKFDVIADLPEDIQPMQRAVCFAQVIDSPKSHLISSKSLAKYFQDVINAYWEHVKWAVQNNLASPELVREYMFFKQRLFHCSCQHIDGYMNAVQKTKMIDWIKADIEPNEAHLLFNVRCLSEGVNLPALDSVVFLSPRSSPIEIIQTVGRVMRRAPNKKLGYIIIPVVINNPDFPEQSLDANPDFKLIWQVVNALKSITPDIELIDGRLNKIDHHVKISYLSPRISTGNDITSVDTVEQEQANAPASVQSGAHGGQADSGAAGGADGVGDAGGVGGTGGAGGTGDAGGAGGNGSGDDGDSTVGAAGTALLSTSNSDGTDASSISAEPAGAGAKSMQRGNLPAVFAAQGAQATNTAHAALAARNDDGYGGKGEQIMTESICSVLVKNVGNRRTWAMWANTVACLFQSQVTLIECYLESHPHLRQVLDDFRLNLSNTLRIPLGQQAVIEMLSQHIVIKPILAELFKGYPFAERNPIAQAMNQMLDMLDKEGLIKSSSDLQDFYRAVAVRMTNVQTLEDRQTVILDLFNNFFKQAFPKLQEKLGIVYTPIEVVDFINRSVDDLLRKEFDLGLASPLVHILDPFTGMGTFIARFMQNRELLPDKDFERKYRQELHAFEIMPIAYYVASINIESVYAERTGHSVAEYEPNSITVLTDTFADKHDIQQLIGEHPVTDINLESNQQLRDKVDAMPLWVILGNPPYSVGQDCVNDDNQNSSYPSLEARIAETYVAQSSNVDNKKSLYDSYIKAFRWASDKLGPQGVVAFVSNAGWLTSASANGMRRSLTQEFTSIYIYHLKGNQRLAGEAALKEGGKIFGDDCRSPVAITFLVKNPLRSHPAKIFFGSVDDYMERDTKLAKLRSMGSIFNAALTNLEQDEYGDWFNHRREDYLKFIPMVDKHQRALAIFNTYSRGVNTGRDAWLFNASKAALKQNVSGCINFFNSQVSAASKADVLGNHFEKDNDATKIKWEDTLISQLKKRKPSEPFDDSLVVKALYRPFCKEYLYCAPTWISRIYKNLSLFPFPEAENRLIVVQGSRANAEFSCCMVNCICSSGFIDNAIVFPRYVYRPATDEELKQANLLPSSSESQDGEVSQPKSIGKRMQRRMSHLNLSLFDMIDLEVTRVNSIQSMALAQSHAERAVSRRRRALQHYHPKPKPNEAMQPVLDYKLLYEHALEDGLPVVEHADGVLEQGNQDVSQTVLNDNPVMDVDELATSPEAKLVDQIYARRRSSAPPPPPKDQPVHVRIMLGKGSHKPVVSVSPDAKESKRTMRLSLVVPYAKPAQNGVYEQNSSEPPSLLTVCSYGADEALVKAYTEKQLTATTKDLVIINGFVREDAICPEAVQFFREAYPEHAKEIDADSLFYYVYGLLHSQDYRTTFANNIQKDSLHIPRVATFESFKAFETAGRKLAVLHVNYEQIPTYKGCLVEGLPARQVNVSQMKYGKCNGHHVGLVKDKTVLHVTNNITIRQIPLEVQDYKINRFSALDWLVKQCGVNTDVTSGIINDYNCFAAEQGDPLYIIKLILKVITLSLETLRIMKELPVLTIHPKDL